MNGDEIKKKKRLCEWTTHYVRKNKIIFKFNNFYFII